MVLSLRTRAFLIAALCLTACGRGTSSPVLPSGGTSGSFQIAITVPHATASTSSNRRSPAYIATTTQSVTVNVTAHGSSTSFTGYPITANLTANSTGCTSTLVSTQCTITVTAAVGNDDVTITTYDGLNGSGNALSAAQTLEIAVMEGKANTLPIVLGGIPTAVEVIAAGTPVGGSQAGVITLSPSSSGTLLAYGLDADGNVILGAGAPAITATSSNSAAIAVTAPAFSAPNAIGIAALGTLPIARITATATPVSGTGTGAVTATVTVQDPALHVIYVADYGSSSIKTYDALGNQLASPGGFPGLSYPYTIDYDQANQLLYVGGGNGPFYVKAYDRFGTQHMLSGSFPGATSSYVEGITYDPMNGYLYINTAGTENAYDGNGNSESISFTSYSDRTFAYGPLHGWLYNGQSTARAWDGNGNVQSPSGGFSGLSCNINVGYNGFNGWLYYTCVYPNSVVAYDQDGNAKTLTGPFTNVNSSNQPQGIAADPTTGHVYVLTNTGYVLAYDQNGNSIFTVTGLNDASGITTAPPP